MLSLQKKLFLVGALCLGLILLARAIPVHGETIQVEGGLAISGEFTGASVGNTETPPQADFEERTFTTSLAPSVLTPVESVVLPSIVGEERFFQTASSTTPTALGELAISNELTFQTPVVQSETPGNPPGSSGGNGGGGGSGGSGGGGGSSGGGYGYRVPIPIPMPTTRGGCSVYLTKFIRLGVDNDSAEVLKLQRFLRDYEGFANVPLSGVYDLVTYQAVMVFQTRYAAAILKPWGIDYPTGYVYITTILAINNLYCERDPATTLDLRYRRLLQSPNEANEAVSTSTPTTTLPEMGERRARWQLAALGLLDFIKDHFWWWLIFIFLVLMIILFSNFNSDSDKEERGP